MRLTSSDTRPTPTISPTMAPVALIDAFGRTGSRQARQLAAASVLVRVRPVVMMPKNPMMIASQRVAFGWLSAELIWVATPPVTPALLVTSVPLTWPERNPRMPTAKSRSGTKNKKRRNATALLTTVPAAPRSRSYRRSPRSTSGRSRWRSNSCSARVRHTDAVCLLRSTSPPRWPTDSVGSDSSLAASGTPRSRGSGSPTGGGSGSPVVTATIVTPDPANHTMALTVRGLGAYVI